MPARVEPPDFEPLLKDLRVVREAGLARLRQLELPALVIAVRALGVVDDDREVTVPLIEEVLRSAVTDLGESLYGLTARALLGIAANDRDRTPAELRVLAALEWDVEPDYFRRQPETKVLTQVADVILSDIARHHMHQAHLEMARRAPTDSRLAINWMERFSAYYWIWNAVYGLGADLTAYRSTLLEADRPWDKPPSEDWPDGYTQEFQAEGYGRSALFHYATFMVRREWFVARYGGQWLFADGNAERDVSDAVYRIGWHASEMNQRDDSYLRHLHRDTGGELHPFLTKIAKESIGSATHDEWQEWLQSCKCTWDITADSTDREHFPTHRTQPSIAARCPIHQVILACSDYLLLVDEDWRRIADWYSLDAAVRPGIGAEGLHRGLTTR